MTNITFTPTGSQLDGDAIADLLFNSGDRLIGVDLNINEPGLNEQDTLTGGSGKDTFVLGNKAGIFYNDGNNFSSGDAGLECYSRFKY